MKTQGISAHVWPIFGAALLILAMVGTPAVAATKFTERDSIRNSRHNLTQDTGLPGGPNSTIMDSYRGNYGELCVYCHTPHGASTVVVLPLWNRTILNTTFQTYTPPPESVLIGTVTPPGARSLACLSCHDGVTAVDSVINMPGPGRYRKEQETTQDDAWLSTWSNASGLGPGAHMAMTDPGCLTCHAPGPSILSAGHEAIGNFEAMKIGTDLRNDHPVGITYPTITGSVDFNPTTGAISGAKFFDTNGNGRMDKNEIRLYDSGQGAEVECSSCHDPHGVAPSPGAQFYPTFLRRSNATSGVCLTCHAK